jgi:hypothetical protein
MDKTQVLIYLPYHIGGGEKSRSMKKWDEK